jgi:DNA-binding NarL/FixJ family response regulator
VKIVALVDDLMDRSRLAGPLPDIVFISDAAASVGADVVIIELGRNGHVVDAVRQATPGAHIVAFGPHVDEATLAAARADGADRVLSRSQFFRDPVAAVTHEG